MAPPGGPKDITPPELLLSIPENGTVNFNGGRVELHFSEYIEERTIEKSINILPNLLKEPEFIYKGKKIYIDFPDSLIDDQTYIIIINRTLSDEHNVKLSQGIQVAFSTGEKIDQGSIAGKVYYSKDSSVQLWKLHEDNDVDIFFNRKPDYVLDVTDEGYYEFKFLSPGKYKIVAIDKALSGIPIIPDKMVYGLSSTSVLDIKNQNALNNINIKIPDYIGSVKMTGAEFIKENWGSIIFSRSITEFTDTILFNMTNDDLSISDFDIFQDPLDDTRLNFILFNAVNDYVSINTKGLYKQNRALIDSGFIRIKMDTTKDTTNLKVTQPGTRYIHNIRSDSVLSLRIVFSNPIKIIEEESPLSLLEDSVFVPTEFVYETPLSINLFPKDNWKPNTSYSLQFLRNGIVPRYGRAIKDSVLSISFSTSDYQGFGSLEISTLERPSEYLMAELRNMEKSSPVLRRIVNSKGIIKINYIPEGNYSLMFFHDIDKNLQYTYGEIDPYRSSEWFYDFPDTIKIRTNWEYEINKVQLKVFN